MDATATEHGAKLEFRGIIDGRDKAGGRERCPWHHLHLGGLWGDVDVAGSVADLESGDVIGKWERYRGSGLGWHPLHFDRLWCDMEAAGCGAELDFRGIIGGRDETGCGSQQRLHLHVERSSAVI